MNFIELLEGTMQQGQAETFGGGAEQTTCGIGDCTSHQRKQSDANVDKALSGEYEDFVASDEVATAADADGICAGL